MADQKNGPCGAAGSVRGDAVCVLRPGASIEIAWDETIEHPGHFRVSFDDAGQDGFIDPETPEDLDNSPAVLVDGIPDRDVEVDQNSRYTLVITLPDIECDTCTLQLIQVMIDKPPFGDGNDIYYQCADITLSAGAPETPGPNCVAAETGSGADAGPTVDQDAGPGGGADPTSSGAVGGCAVTATPRSNGVTAALMAFLALAWRRRRRNR